MGWAFSRGVERDPLVAVLFASHIFEMKAFSAAPLSSLFLAALTTACSCSCSRTPAPDAPRGDDSIVDEASPSPADSTHPDAVSPAADTAQVVVVGTVVQREDHLEVCPAGQVAPCPGFRVLGNVPPEAISKAQQRTIWRLEGTLRGSELLVASATEEPRATMITIYENPCPEYQDTRARGGETRNPTEKMAKMIRQLQEKHADYFAGNWWDSERQTMVVSVTGEKDRLKQELDVMLPGERVCLVAGAKFNLDELDEARRKTNGMLTKAGAKMQDMSLDVVGNRFLYHVETISQAALDAIEKEVGDAVKIVPFIIAKAGSVVPEVPRRGSVELVTESTRRNVQMQALGVFRVRYDDEMKCVYLENLQGERVLPVWPMGYWATHNPLQIHDFDDRVVATGEGTVEFVGGEVGIDRYHADNLCGAQSVWIGSPTKK